MKHRPICGLMSAILPEQPICSMESGNETTTSSAKLYLDDIAPRVFANFAVRNMGMQNALMKKEVVHLGALLALVSAAYTTILGLTYDAHHEKNLGVFQVLSEMGNVINADTQHFGEVPLLSFFKQDASGRFWVWSRASQTMNRNSIRIDVSIRQERCGNNSHKISGGWV